MELTLGPNEKCLTVAEIAERLKLNEETVRRLFINEPGVIVICTPRKGRRVAARSACPSTCFDAS